MSFLEISNQYQIDTSDICFLTKNLAIHSEKVTEKKILAVYSKVVGAVKAGHRRQMARGC